MFPARHGQAGISAMQNVVAASQEAPALFSSKQRRESSLFCKSVDVKRRSVRGCSVVLFYIPPPIIRGYAPDYARRPPPIMRE